MEWRERASGRRRGCADNKKATDKAMAKERGMIEGFPLICPHYKSGLLTGNEARVNSMLSYGECCENGARMGVKRFDASEEGAGEEKTIGWRIGGFQGL